MNTLKSFGLLIYYNTTSLPRGIKMLFCAAALAVVLQAISVSSQMSWGIAIATVISAVCVSTKLQNLIGKSK